MTKIRAAVAEYLLQIQVTCPTSEALVWNKYADKGGQKEEPIIAILFRASNSW